MQSQSSVTPSARQRAMRAAPARAHHRDRLRQGAGPRRERRLLARYADSHGRRREIIWRYGCAGSVLVVDRDAASRGDHRLLAHLCADEPAENARVVCNEYLERLSRHGDCGFRTVVAEDAETVPFADEQQSKGRGARVSGAVEAVDELGCAYRLQYLHARMSIPQLRWCRSNGSQESEVCLREAIARLESYEPLCSLTACALATHRGDADVSTTTLRAELGKGSREPDRPQPSPARGGARCGRA